MSCGIKKAPTAEPCQGIRMCFVSLCTAGPLGCAWLWGWAAGCSYGEEERIAVSPHFMELLLQSSLPSPLAPDPGALSLSGTQFTIGRAPRDPPGLPAPSPAPPDRWPPESGGLKFTSLSSPPNFYLFSSPWLEWGTLVDRTVNLPLHLQECLYLFCSFCKKYFDRFC